MPWCGELQGASSDWWNFRHLNHHSKPNILTKDPDVTFDPLLLVGRSLAIEVRCFLFIMQPSPRMLHYALHPSVCLSVYHMPTVRSRVEHRTMFKLSSEVNAVMRTGRVSLRSLG